MNRFSGRELFIDCTLGFIKSIYTSCSLIDEEEKKDEEEEWKPFIPATPSPILYGYYSTDEPGTTYVTYIALL